MNTILKDIIMVIGSGIIGGTFFVLLKNKIFAKTKETIVKIIPDEDKAKVKELYEKGVVPEVLYKQICTVPTPTECFNAKKAINGVVNVKSSVLWMKDIVSIFNLRKLIIVGVICSVIWGYGYYKGHNGVQPILDWRGKEEWVSLNEHYLHISKDGTMEVVASDKKTVLKKITVKDLENLKKNLQPYGLIFDPVLVLGAGMGAEKTGFEAGVGVRYFKWFKWFADVCLTNQGFYPFGISYKLTENSAIGLSAGTGFKGNDIGLFKRFLLKFTVKF